MSLVPKEILLSHLQRAEGAKELTLPIDFFRDLLYQAIPRTWVELTEDEIQTLLSQNRFAVFALIRAVEAKLKAKNERKEKNT